MDVSEGYSSSESFPSKNCYYSHVYLVVLCRKAIIPYDKFKPCFGNNTLVILNYRPLNFINQDFFCEMFLTILSQSVFVNGVYVRDALLLVLASDVLFCG